MLWCSSLKTNLLPQPQTLWAFLMADTFASSKHLQGLHATYANVTTVHLLYIKRFWGEENNGYTTGNKPNAKSGRQEEKKLQGQQKKKKKLEKVKKKWLFGTPNEISKGMFSKHCRQTLAYIRSRQIFYIYIHMHTRTAMSVLAMNTRFELYLFALQDADKLPESFSHALDIWTHSCLQT